MSQTETIMLIALGFAVASLIAVFAGKAAWNLAYRLGARRTRKQLPANLVELQADKDRIRAEYAILQQKSEFAAEALKGREVGQMAEVMRNRNRIGQMAEEIARRDKWLAERDTELAALRGQIEIVELDLERRAGIIQALETRLREQHEMLMAQPVMAPLPAAPPQSVLPTRLLPSEFRPQPTLPHNDADAGETQDRLSKRIRDLARVTDQIRSQFASPGAGRPVMPEIKASPFAPRQLSIETSEARIDAAKQEVQDVLQGLNRLDEERAKTFNGLGPQLDRQPEKSSMSPKVANVISLAQRLRSLKKDVRG